MMKIVFTIMQLMILSLIPCAAFTLFPSPLGDAGINTNRILPHETSQRQHQHPIGVGCQYSKPHSNNHRQMFIIQSREINKMRQTAGWSTQLHSSQGDNDVDRSQMKDAYSTLTINGSTREYQTQTTTTDETTPAPFNPILAKSLLRQLWYLPLLSILSGLTPASRIIANSHISRLPDTPIAHDIDTFLLWPAIGDTGADADANPLHKNLPPTIFQTPAAAITSEDMYGVDWDEVMHVYWGHVGTSLGWSLVIFVGLYAWLSVVAGGGEDDDGANVHGSMLE